MTEQYRLKDPRPYRHRIFEVSGGGGLVLLIFIIFVLGLLFLKQPDPKARDVMLGTELDQNGYIVKDTRTVPTNVKEIYLQFYLVNRGNAETPLEFHWYSGDDLAYSTSGGYEDSFIAVYLEPDSDMPDGLPIGDYHVEVWIGDTMILYKPFAVR